MDDLLMCSDCRGEIVAEDLECPHCGFVLDPAEEFRRALMAPQSAAQTASGGREASWDDAGTVPLKPFVGDESVPRLSPGADLTRADLHPFEAFIMSRIDGASTLRQVAATAAIGLPELKAILLTLMEQHLVEVVLPRPPAAKATPTPRPFPVLVPPPSHKPDTVVSRPPKQNDHPITQPERFRAATLLQRATVLERRGDLAAAIALIERGIAQTKSPAPLYNRLATLVVTARRDYFAAEGMLRLALRLDANNRVYEQNLMRIEALAAASSDMQRRKRQVGQMLSRHG